MIVRLVLNMVKRNDTIVLEEMSIYGIFLIFQLFINFIIIPILYKALFI